MSRDGREGGSQVLNTLSPYWWIYFWGLRFSSHFRRSSYSGNDNCGVAATYEPTSVAASVRYPNSLTIGDLGPGLAQLGAVAKQLRSLSRFHVGHLHRLQRRYLLGS